MGTVEFWFEFASTYSHIAAQTIGRASEDAGVTVVWRPFLLGPIFKAQGWTDSPFNLYPAKGTYMWRNMERDCARLAVPFGKPTQFPRNGLLAARVATAAEDERWQPDFVQRVYQANFVEDADIGDVDVLRECLAGSCDPDHWLNAGRTDGVRDLLRKRTEEAVAAGIFGAPTFRVHGEIFWGADRLEQALELAARM